MNVIIKQFLHSPATYSLLGPSILLSILKTNISQMQINYQWGVVKSNVFCSEKGTVLSCNKGWRYVFQRKGSIKGT
jgi:hypothetical protein